MLSDTLYDLDVVSKRLGVKPVVVRRYARMGLVVPSGWRGREALYTPADLARLRRIVRLTRDVGLNSAGVEVVLRLLDQVEALRDEVHVLRLRARSDARTTSMSAEPPRTMRHLKEIPGE